MLTKIPGPGHNPRMIELLLIFGIGIVVGVVAAFLGQETIRKILKNKAAFLIIGVILFLAGLIYFFTHEGPLENVRIGSVRIEQGESLASACAKLESEIKKMGDPWMVVVDPRIADKRAPEGFGFGGYAYVGLYCIYSEFGCRRVVEEKAGSSTNFVGRHPEAQFCESPAFEERPKAGHFASKCS